MSLLKLKAKLKGCVNQNGQQQHSGNREQLRNEFIETCYILGGKPFVERVMKYGRTEKGIAIDNTLWYKEYLEIIGDFRLPHVMTTGCAQVGKTLGHSLLNIDCLTTGKVNTGWFYDTRVSLDQNVPKMFRPVARYWIENMEADNIRFIKNNDRATNTSYQIDGVNGIFGYVSANKHKADDGTAAAGGTIVAYQIDIAFLEERSQYAPGSGDPIRRRLDASVMPTQPIRELGTPGGGQGIEAEMGKADRYFYPHYYCPNCEKWLPLDSKGCLLTKTKRKDVLGKMTDSYFTESGRPAAWHYRDEKNPIGSAYIGCCECHKPLTMEQRLNSSFRCIKTGESARDFLDCLPQSVPEKFWTISIHLSPLTRKKNTLAEEIIKTGLTTIMTNDWQQQMLGWQSETEVCFITAQLLQRAMESPAPTHRKPDYTLAGIDVGRSEDWLVIIDFYLPENSDDLSVPEIIEQTVREVVFGSGVPRNEIPETLRRYEVGYGLIDNEPSRESSMNLCRSTCLDMGNQVTHLNDTVKNTMVSDGGIEYPCWNIRNEKFMNSVLEGFILVAPDGFPLYRLPPEWEKWVNNPVDRSPLVHLSGPWRDSNSKWNRGKDNLDDLYMAFVFTEAAFYLTLADEYGHAPTMKVGSYLT